MSRYNTEFLLASGMAEKIEHHQNEIRVGLYRNISTNRIVVGRRGAKYVGTSGIVGH